jgi:hypothetical protein
VEIKMEDVPLKSRMTSLLQSSKESMQDLNKLDEEVRCSILHLIINHSTLKTDRPARAITP